MLDYYSDQIPPSNQDIINSISKEISELKPHKHIRRIRYIVKYQLRKMGRDSLGSLSGYLMFGRRMLLMKCINTINKNKLSLKTIFHVIILFNRLYKFILHERYKPNGVGYIECLHDYYNKALSLPPIGTKTLPIPIKDYN